MPRRPSPLGTLFCCLGLAGTALAEEEGGSGIEWEGGVTATVQTTSDSRVKSQAQGSFDLTGSMPLGPGKLTLYLEGSSSVPDVTHVAAMIGEANADAGSALTKNGNGRLQISELHYAFPLAGGTVTTGLMDASGFLDTSKVANDETTQFINANLVNNPTIEFPSYTLGVAYQGEPDGAMPGLTLLLAEGQGLGDGSVPHGYNYPSLFHSKIVDLDGDGIDDRKGMFGAVELGWELAGETALRLGYWNNSMDHTQLSGGAGLSGNSGFYGVVDGALGEAKWNLRAGTADSDVSAATDFLSGALEIPTEYAVTGVGVGHTWANHLLGAGTGGTTVAEAYARFDLTEHLQLTPSIQWIRNSGFDSSSTLYDDRITVVGVRGQLTF